MPEDSAVASKPANLSYEQAAAIPSGGIGALQVFRKGNIRSGQKVLVYGASSSVGSLGVQIAKHFGAEVTAVCSTANLEWVKALGADQVIDYKKEDIFGRPERYELVFDGVGKMMSGLKKSDFQKMLEPDGTFVSIEMNYKETAEALDYLREMAEAGRLNPYIDRRYTLDQLVEAHRYVEEGHKKGSVVVTVEHE
jgi:NADPH:quinone reductase-like Zn-dependent oxidoreductase